MSRTLIAVGLAAALVVAASRSEAQVEPDVRAAARAFEEGQRAQLAGEYERAANLFEVAHRAAPAPAALRAAIRNYRAAGALARAATLSLEAISRYATDSATRALAQEVLSENEDGLARIRVRCALSCGVSVDGALVSLQSVREMELFVSPGARTLRADFDGGGQATATVDVAAGEVRTVELDLPAPTGAAEPPTEEPATADPATGAGSADPTTVEPATAEPEAGASSRGAFRREPRRLARPSRRGWPPAVTYVGVGVTAVLGAALVWSVASLLDTSESYQANPTRELYERGQDKIRRTGLLGAATGLAALGTLLIAVLATDWRDDGPSSARSSDRDNAWVPTLSFSPEGGAVGFVRRFGGYR